MSDNISYTSKIGDMQKKQFNVIKQEEAKQEFDYEKATKEFGYDRLSLQKRTNHENRRKDIFNLADAIINEQKDWISKRNAHYKDKTREELKKSTILKKIEKKIYMLESWLKITREGMYQLLVNEMRAETKELVERELERPFQEHLKWWNETLKKYKDFIDSQQGLFSKILEEHQESINCYEACIQAKNFLGAQNEIKERIPEMEWNLIEKIDLDLYRQTTEISNDLLFQRKQVSELLPKYENDPQRYAVLSELVQCLNDMVIKARQSFDDSEKRSSYSIKSLIFHPDVYQNISNKEDWDVNNVEKEIKNWAEEDF